MISKADLPVISYPPSDETVDGQLLTTEELTLVRRWRAQKSFELGFYAGVQASQTRLESLANECGGGTGTGSTAEGLRSAAKHLDNVHPPKSK